VTAFQSRRSTPAPAVAVIVTGVGLGVVTTLSPAGVALAAVSCGLIAWAVRGLRGRERRWILTCLSLTMAARVAAVGALAASARPAAGSFATLSGGDAQYLLQRSIWMRNALVDAPFAPRDYFEAFDAGYGSTGYNYALAWFHLVFGPSPYAAHLLSTVLFFAAAVMMFRAVHARFGPRSALIGLLLLTVMPTVFLWSVTPLKEAPYFLLAAIAVCGAVAVLEHVSAWRTAGAIVATGGAILLAAAIRADVAALTAIVLVFGAIVWFAGRSRRVLAALLAAALAAAVVVASSPRAAKTVQETAQLAARRHIGHVLTSGHVYRLLDDERYFDERLRTLTPAELTAFGVRAVVRFFTVPEPWIMRGRSELLLLPQQMLWYLLVALGVMGAVAGLRRQRPLASLLAAFVVVGALLIGLNSGNVGTLIRHRDTVVPFAVWLSALGAARQIERGPSRWFNRVDLWAVGFVVVMLPAGVLLYVAFHLPAPRLDGVDPQKVYTPGRVVLRGQHLRPYLHVYPVPHGQPLVLLDRHDRPARAGYLLRTPAEAEVELAAIPPGIYDVVLADSAEPVARLDSAFTVVDMAAAPVGVVIANGRFQNLDARASASLTPGTVIHQADGAIAVEVLEVGRDEPQVEAIGPFLIKTWVRIDGRVQRAAAVRLRCQVVGGRCWYAGQAVVADGPLDFPLPGGTVRFVVDAVRPDTTSADLFDTPTADALVDFITWPDMERAVKVDDRDAGAPQSRSVRPARIARLLASERFVGEAALGTDPYGGHFTLQQPLVRIRAVVRFARQPSGALDWRNRPLSVGSRFSFETRTYALDGTIVGMAQ
jgi:hypothetical protein